MLKNEAFQTRFLLINFFKNKTEKSGLRYRFNLSIKKNNLMLHFFSHQNSSKKTCLSSAGFDEVNILKRTIEYFLSKALFKIPFEKTNHISTVAIKHIVTSNFKKWVHNWHGSLKTFLYTERHTIEEFSYCVIGPPLQQNWVVRLACNFIQQFLKEFQVTLSECFSKFEPEPEIPQF